MRAFASVVTPVGTDRYQGNGPSHTAPRPSASTLLRHKTTKFVVVTAAPSVRQQLSYLVFTNASNSAAPKSSRKYKEAT